MPENVHWKTDDDSITIWWDPPPTVDEILVRGYTISYGIGTPNRRVIIEGANTNAFTINKLKSNTTYVFALTAYNEADGEDSEKVFLLLLLKLEKVQMTNWSICKHQQISKYGEYKSLNLEKITSTVPYVLRNNLQPSTEYEIIVKVIMPNGIESAWSNREVIRTSSNVTLIKGSKLFELRFDFEKSERCFFYSDQSAPLQWEMIETNNKLKVRRAKHFASLQSRIVDGNYGQLISTPIILNDNNYCLSMWIYIRQFSKGIFTVGLLRKLKDYNYENSLYVGKLEEIPNEQWRHLLLNFINSHDQFQITFHVEKEDGNQFWLALDDITVHSGKCKPDPNAILRYNQQSAC
ncbi:MAM domain-containing glycosylphosphatidylinositol anchor protein 1 [Dirofilaria immitis]|nr:MAM domain-containing glycosylphosphatidylinositol anchor protein 1 [Dirofilaria immitis]